MNKMIGMSVACVVAAAIPSIASAQTASGVGTPYNMFSNVTNTGTFGNNGMIGNTAFSNTFTFVVTQGGILASDFSNAASRNGGDSDIDFTSGTLVGGSLAGPVSFTRLLGEPTSLVEVWGLTGPLAIAAGTYTLTVTGQSFGPSSTFAGNFNVAGAVPEPASWALMIAGIGMVGGAMRRRKVATTVSFG